jgi:hypothetical protein
MCELGEGRKKNYIADLVMDLILRVIRRREKPRKYPKCQASKFRRNYGTVGKNRDRRRKRLLWRR